MENVFTWTSCQATSKASRELLLQRYHLLGGRGAGRQILLPWDKSRLAACLCFQSSCCKQTGCKLKLLGQTSHLTLRVFFKMSNCSYNMSSFLFINILFCSSKDTFLEVIPCCASLSSFKSCQSELRASYRQHSSAEESGGRRHLGNYCKTDDVNMITCDKTYLCISSDIVLLPLLSYLFEHVGLY